MTETDRPRPQPGQEFTLEAIASRHLVLLIVPCCGRVTHIQSPEGRADGSQVLVLCLFCHVAYQTSVQSLRGGWRVVATVQGLEFTTTTNRRPART